MLLPLLLRLIIFSHFALAVAVTWVLHLTPNNILIETICWYWFWLWYHTVLLLLLLLLPILVNRNSVHWQSGKRSIQTHRERNKQKMCWNETMVNRQIDSMVVSYEYTETMSNALEICIWAIFIVNLSKLKKIKRFLRPTSSYRLKWYSSIDSKPIGQM